MEFWISRYDIQIGSLNISRGRGLRIRFATRWSCTDTLWGHSRRWVYKQYVMNLYHGVHEAAYHDGYETTAKLWERAFKRQLQWWGFGRRARKMMWEFGLWGHNWKALHRTKAQDKYTIERWLQRFADSLSYCSDRMSMDRLLRTHWEFSMARVKYMMEKEGVEDA